MRDYDIFGQGAQKVTSVEPLIIGPQGWSVDGSGRQPNRGTRDFMAVVQAGHGDFTEASLRGWMFGGANQAAQAVSVALATTYTGLCLSNPIGSGYDAILYMANYALSVAPAAIATLGLIGGFSATANVAHTAAGVIENASFGHSRVSNMKLDTSATIPTPTWKFHLANGFTAAALPSGNMPPFDGRGIYTLKPGGFIAIGALTAVTGMGAFLWEEVPTGTYA